MAETPEAQQAPAVSSKKKVEHRERDKSDGSEEGQGAGELRSVGLWQGFTGCKRCDTE